MILILIIKQILIIKNIIYTDVNIKLIFSIASVNPHLRKHLGLNIYSPIKSIIMNRTIGIVLIVIGAAMLIWTGFTYTKKEKIVDAGPIQISADRQKSVNWPPYLGGILLVGGIVIVATSKKA
ncbi:putative membrane protein [Mucilaginibacter sp. UYP25]